ncbi:hypothetical protein [Natranaerobius trueperi]|uniref:Uncharacterized protein n=1 Tax=Natranaerobius trueperi TaxID=759412 RepID=A0A226C1J5_9FIRM|nr:hypothetical protein [Natranaerobius trueperi]OWZ84309.1 hypothetical protein CDO51_04430 [Natranaerobius trueperi]
MPKLNKKRILIVILTFVISVVIILGAYFLWKQQQVIGPLEDYLNNHEQVEEYKIKDDGNDLEIYLQFDYEPFLIDPYHEITNEIQKTVSTDYKIIIEDERNNSLKEAYYELQFILWHHYQSNEYDDMLDNLSKIKQEHSLDHLQVFVLDEGFFIQMKDNDSELIEVYDRPLTSGGGDGTNDTRN